MICASALILNNVYYGNRIESLINGNDTSSLQRFIGSMEVFSLVENKYVGMGTGSEPLLESINLKSIKYMTKYNANINNAFGFILFENGWLGLGFVLIWFLRKKSKYELGLFILWFLLNGAYFFAYFWFYYVFLKLNENRLLLKHTS